jgi:hypothetical protein
MIALVLGLSVGYIYALSLGKQGKALHFSPALSIFRTAFVAVISYHLLQRGIFPLILFLGSLAVTVLCLLATQKE